MTSGSSRETVSSTKNGQRWTMSERPRPRPTTKVYVGNIPPGTREKRLREIFEAFGPVGECSILKDYGFVHFENTEDADEAIQLLDGSDIDGNRISVELSHSRRRKFSAPRRWSSSPPRRWSRSPPQREYRREPARHSYYERDQYSRGRGYDDYESSRRYRERSRSPPSQRGSYYDDRYVDDRYHSSYSERNGRGYQERHGGMRDGYRR